MYSLLTNIQVNDRDFPIREKGDFRMVLDCFRAMNDTELSDMERLFATLIIFYEDFDDISDIPRDKETLIALQKGMMDFFNACDQELKKSNTGGFNLIDWDKDSNLIVSAINNVAKQEIRALDYLHWWTFLSYYSAIGECPLATIISIRYKIAHNQKLEKHEKKFRMDNPEYFNIDLRSHEQKAADEYIEKLWNGGN